MLGNPLLDNFVQPEFRSITFQDVSMPNASVFSSNLNLDPLHCLFETRPLVGARLVGIGLGGKVGDIVGAEGKLLVVG